MGFRQQQRLVLFQATSRPDVSPAIVPAILRSAASVAVAGPISYAKQASGLRRRRITIIKNPPACPAVLISWLAVLQLVYR